MSREPQLRPFMLFSHAFDSPLPPSLLPLFFPSSPLQELLRLAPGYWRLEAGPSRIGEIVPGSSQNTPFTKERESSALTQ